MITKAPQPTAVNRLEFESLSIALRHSWREGDIDQAAATLEELSQLYPDLLVSPNSHKSDSKPSCYETLKLNAAATEEEVVTGFFKQLRRVLRDKDMPSRSRSYVKLLDAAFVLRKPRLRLSHDLAAVSCWLNSNASPPMPVMASAKYLAKPSISIAKSETMPYEATAEAPIMLKLLEQSGMASPDEVAALYAQMKRAPGVSLDVLITKAGYLSSGEMASLKLAELLLRNKQVALPQILVALYDERNSGVRMAESLQARGWLEVQVK